MVDARSRSSNSSLGLGLHSVNGDKLYRWAMWRMYINEDMSRKITDRRDLGDKSATVTSVVRPYLKHPDCCRYGKLMRRRFGYEQDTVRYKNRLKLSDGQYLVYGIPRVSLNKYVPSELQQLKQSCPDIPSTFANISESSFDNLDDTPIENETPSTDDDHKNSTKDEAEQITELFKFVSSENTPNTSPRQSTNDTTDVAISHDASTIQHENEITNIDNIANDAVDKERLVTRSKVFWKKLAQRKHDIIELGKEKSNIPLAPPPPPTKSHETHVISGDILLKQQTLLKATPKSKPKKDLWKSLAENKTEILKLSDVKQKESKSSHFWNFIAGKKNDLLQIKRGVKSYSDVAGGRHDNHKTVTVLNNDTSGIKPGNFQDSFQRELEEKLRRFRQRHLQGDE